MCCLTVSSKWRGSTVMQCFDHCVSMPKFTWPLQNKTLFSLMLELLVMRWFAGLPNGQDLAEGVEMWVMVIIVKIPNGVRLSGCVYLYTYFILNLYVTRKKFTHYWCLLQGSIVKSSFRFTVYMNRFTVYMNHNNTTAQVWLENLSFTENRMKKQTFRWSDDASIFSLNVVQKNNGQILWSVSSSSKH